jgi:hypothetical protein
MIQRCTNKNYRQFTDYGGRGITICERWRFSFQAFASDMGPRPPGMTVERKNKPRYSWKHVGQLKEQKQQTKLPHLSPSRQPPALSNIAEYMAFPTGRLSKDTKLNWPTELALQIRLAKQE